MAPSFRIREKIMDLSLIDVCLPCYLTDHHNRDGEQLLSIPVDGKTRNGEIRRMLHAELQNYEFPESFDWDSAERAIDDCFKSSDGRRLFDSSLDRDLGDYDESCYAHFLLTYG